MICSVDGPPSTANLHTHCAQNLIEVDLSNVLQLSDMFRETILPRLHNLQVLNLRSSSCGDRELHVVAENCPNLK